MLTRRHAHEILYYCSSKQYRVRVRLICDTKAFFNRAYQYDNKYTKGAAMARLYRKWICKSSVNTKTRPALAKLARVILARSWLWPSVNGVFDNCRINLSISDCYNRSTSTNVTKIIVLQSLHLEI